MINAQLKGGPCDGEQLVVPSSCREVIKVKRFAVGNIEDHERFAYHITGEGTSEGCTIFEYEGEPRK